MRKNFVRALSLGVVSISVLASCGKKLSQAEAATQASTYSADTAAKYVGTSTTTIDLKKATLKIGAINMGTDPSKKTSQESSLKGSDYLVSSAEINALPSDGTFTLSGKKLSYSYSAKKVDVSKEISGVSGTILGDLTIKENWDGNGLMTYYYSYVKATSDENSDSSITVDYECETTTNYSWTESK